MCFEKLLWITSEMVNARSFQLFAIVFSTHENLLVGISLALGTKIKPLSKHKCILRKCHGVYQKWWILEHSTLCNCVQHPWKLTCRDFWSSRNKKKPLSKQKCVLKKCCGVSQKWWMVGLTNLCQCVEHPWTLACWDFWMSRNKWKPLSKQKCFEKMLWGISEMVNARAFNPLPLCSAPLKTYL